MAAVTFRIFGQAELDRGHQRRRQAAIDRRSRRRVADGSSPMMRWKLERCCGELGFRGQLWVRPGQAAPRLRDVGARHLADIEAVLGLAQLFFKNDDVVLAQIENGRIAQHIHIGGRAILQHALFRIAQRFAGAEHVAFCLAHAIKVAIAVEDRLGRRDAKVAGVGRGLVAEPAGDTERRARFSRAEVAVAICPVAVTVGR